MSKSYRSDALAAIHETASDLHDAGVMDKRTLRGFDELCLTPVRSMTAENIRALRARARQPGRVRALSERHHRPHQPMGAGREAPGRCVAQAAEPGRAARPRRDRVIGRDTACDASICESQISTI
jgi:hypothetical protein